MGHLQRHLRLGKLSHIWLSHILQPLLVGGYSGIPRNAVQREERSLALDECKGRVREWRNDRQQ